MITEITDQFLLSALRKLNGRRWTSIKLLRDEKVWRRNADRCDAAVRNACLLNYKGKHRRNPVGGVLSQTLSGGVCRGLRLHSLYFMRRKIDWRAVARRQGDRESADGKYHNRRVPSIAMFCFEIHSPQFQEQPRLLVSTT